MEGSTEEKNMRLSFKQTAKGFFYCEYTARGNVIEEIEARINELESLALTKLKTLNGVLK